MHTISPFEIKFYFRHLFIEFCNSILVYNFNFVNMVFKNKNGFHYF